MATRRKRRLSPYPAVPHHNPSQDWVRDFCIKINGRTVEPGTELGIHGEGGQRFIFQQYVTTPSGRSWVDCWEVEAGKVGRYRSFKVDRVRTVHRLSKSRLNIAAA